MASLMNTPIQALAPEDAASVGPAQAYTSTKDAIDQWIESQRAQSEAQGMWDPATNLPTLKGMHEAVQQLGYNFEGGLKPKGLLNAPVAEVPGLADRISTRVPTAVGSDNPHLNADLMVGLESSRNSDKAFPKNADLIRTYPDIRTEGLPDADAVSEAFINHLKDNLLALHDSIPPEIRARAQQWYEGANTIANRMAEQYGISPRSAAATLAAMSPQKDWFQNVDLAKRVLDIRQQQGNMSATPEMGPILDRFVAMQKKPAAAEALQSAVDNIQSGVPLAQIKDPFEQAVWIRAYDEAHNPRSYQVVTPEGDFAGPALNKDGSEQAVAWGSFNPIEKAMQVLKDDSTENISRQMGGNHKVRNFYNNIISPNSPNGDVTIDTHAIAAGHMRPLGSGDPVVDAGLGLSGSSSAATGSRGLYGLYAEAYRRAAAQAGILPRQMQSITWEGVRGLFSPEQKRNANLVQSVNQVWDQYRGGQIDAPTARAAITELAGGINAPEWAGRGP